MSDTAIQKKPFVRGLNLTFGLLSVNGNVLNVRKPNVKAEESFKMICPLHPSTPHLVSQRYVCADGIDPEPFLPGDCLKGRPTDDGYVVVDADEAKAIRTSDIPPKTLDLAAHPYEPSSTFASGGAYVFAPESANQFYSTLLLLVDEQGVVETESGPKMLVGLVAYKKGSETFVRLERWGKQLVLRELIRPQDVDEFQPTEGTVDTKVLDMARQLIDAQAEDFDPDAYRAKVRDRIAALVEQAADGQVDVKALTAAPRESIEDLLMKSLEAAVAKKKGQ
jgi:hypothetical protein